MIRHTFMMLVAIPTCIILLDVVILSSRMDVLPYVIIWYYAFFLRYWKRPSYYFHAASIIAFIYLLVFFITTQSVADRFASWFTIYFFIGVIALTKKS